MDGLDDNVGIRDTRNLCNACANYADIFATAGTDLSPDRKEKKGVGSAGRRTSMTHDLEKDDVIPPCRGSCSPGELAQRSPLN